MLFKIFFLFVLFFPICVFTQINVIWENLKNVSISNEGITKLNGIRGQATSKNMLYGTLGTQINNGSFSFQTGNFQNENKAIGFVMTESGDALYENIDYGFSFQNNKVKIFGKEGSIEQNYSGLQSYKIERLDNDMLFSVNNQIVYQEKVDNSEYLIIRTQLRSNNSIFSNVQVNFNTTRFEFNPLINYQDLQVNLNSGNLFNDISWSDGERSINSRKYIKDKYQVRFKNSYGNEVNRSFLIGNQINWQSLNGVSINGTKLIKTQGNNWGSAISDITFNSNEKFSFELPFFSQTESKIIGYSNSYLNIQNISNCWAGFFIANDYQLKVIYGGNIVKTVEAFQNDRIAIHYNNGVITWELNGLTIHEIAANFTADLKVITLLKNNSSISDVVFLKQNLDIIKTEVYNVDSIKANIKIDLTSLGSQISPPYSYYISDNIIPPFSTLDSNFVEQSQFFEIPNSNKYTFSDLDYGRYYISVFGADGERLLGKYIDVQPDFNFITNSNIIKVGNSFFHESNSTRAVLSENLNFNQNLTVKFINNDNQGTKFVGLVDKTILFNSVQEIKYGFQVQNGKISIVENGQVSSEKYFLRNNNELSIQVEKTELSFIIEREIIKKVVFVSNPNLSIGITRDFIGEIGKRPGDGIIIINKPPKDGKKILSYSFLFEDTKATCTERLGSVNFKFKSNDRINNIAFTIYDENNIAVATSNSLSENTFFNFQFKPVGIYRIEGSVEYITSNGYQLQTITNLFQEYVFIGITANMLNNDIAGLNRSLSDFVIAPEETGFIRFNPNILISNTDLSVGGVDQNNLTQIFKNIFYLATNRSYDATSNLDKYIAFRNVRYPIDPIFPNQNVANPTRLNVHWGSSPINTFTITSNNSNDDPYITVIFKTTTIEFFYSINFSPTNPFLVLPREALSYYSFGNNISEGEQIDMYHSFKCHPKECTAIIRRPEPICLGQEVQLNVENLFLSDKLSFSWSPSTNLSCTNCLNPVATPTGSLEYFFHYTNEIECPAISVRVEVLTGENCYKTYCENHIIITPNVLQYCPGDVFFLEVVNNHGIDLTNVPMIWTPNVNMSCPTCYKTSIVPNFEGVIRVEMTINGIHCNAIMSTNIKINEKLCEEQPNVLAIDGCCFNNYGAGVYVNEGTKLNVFCHVINEVSIADNQIEKGEFTNKGDIESSRDWVNNGQNNLFNTFEGQTHLIGGYQKIRGNSPIYYYDLYLDGGTSTKEIYNDEYVVNQLAINNAELATRNNTFELINVDPASLTRSNGIVSTDLNQGYFSRKMVDNQTQKYLFPMGSSQSIYRYRPLELNSLQSNLDFKINFVNQIIPASLDINQLAPNVESVYDQYYYKFQSFYNLPNVRITAYFDPVQGNFQAMSHWAASPSTRWESAPGISSNSTPSTQGNTFGLVSATTSGAINLNTENFSLAKAGFYINTDGFGDPGDVIVVTPVLPGDTNGNGTIDPGETPGDTNGNGVIDGTEVEGNGGGGTGGGTGVPTDTGTDLPLTPSPVPGTYVINILSGDCTIPGKIKFTVNTDGYIDPSSVIYLNEGDAIASTVNKLAADLYDVDTENSGLILYSKPKSVEECVNAISVFMGTPDQTSSEFMILNSDPVTGTASSVINEDIHISGLNSNVEFVEFRIDGISFSSTSVVPSTQYSNYFLLNTTMPQFPNVAKGSHKFELKVNINQSATPTSIFGQLIIK